MASILQQQNTLKGFSDEQLGQEAHTPSGQVPPFLVLTELNRRKQMRDSYQGEMAKRGQSTTVAQDLAGPARAAAPMGPSGGLDALLPGGGGIGLPAPASGGASVPGFATGGIVPASTVSPYDGYQNFLDGRDDRQNQAFKLALIEAGLGIAGGQSPNALSNLSGAIPAVQHYGAAMDNIDKQQTAGLNDLAQMQHYQSSDDLARLDAQFRKDQETERTRQFNVGQDPTNPMNQTADVRTANWYESATPAQRSAYDTTHPSYANTGFTQDSKAQNAFGSIFNRVYKEMAAGVDPTNADAVRQAKQAAHSAAVEQFVALYPEWKDTYGAKYAADTEAFGGPADASGDGAVDYSTFFSGN